ncbi:MAG: hypothetical protein VKJ24_20975 [Synechococcales bacterium]|nr:hypothetical protein [Synechococcales bacterium]
MKRLVLSLLTTPTLVGSALCWLVALPAQANPVVQPEGMDAKLCTMSKHHRFNLVCERVSNLQKLPKVAPVDLATDPIESPEEFQMTDEESNAAIALFGCDCQVCVNAMRSLRMMVS